MKTDAMLKHDIEEALAHDPSVSAQSIHVTVQNGVASLYGIVHCETEKTAVEEIARRVGATVTVTQSLQVAIRPASAPADAAIDAAVRHTLDWNILVPRSVHARVVNGVVTLEGQVTWGFQRRAAARAARRVRGVSSVYDRILLAPQTEASSVHDAVKATLARHGTRDANTIGIATADGKVVLSGYARAPQSIANAAFAAWGVDGVSEVIDEVSMSRDRQVEAASASTDADSTSKTRVPGG